MVVKLGAKKDGNVVVNRTLTDAEYEEILRASKNLEEFDYIHFLSINYIKAKEDFLSFDFSAFGIREVDVYNVIFNALNAISNNTYLWETYLKRSYPDDLEIFSEEERQKERKDPRNYKSKSIVALKDSYYYDTNISYTVAKTLRNIIVHVGKPYNEIAYYDDHSRHFLLYTSSLLSDEKVSKSSRQLLVDSHKDYFDIVLVIKEAFSVLDKLNEFAFNFLLKKGWLTYSLSRTKIKEYIDSDVDAAFIAWENLDYPEDHLLRVSHINISINAMRKILSLTVRSMMG